MILKDHLVPKALITLTPASVFIKHFFFMLWVVSPVFFYIMIIIFHPQCFWGPLITSIYV